MNGRGRRKMEKMNKQLLMVATTVFALFLANFSYIVVGSFFDEEDSSEKNQEIALTFNFRKPSAEKKEIYDVITINGLNNFGNPGEPYLPIKSVNVLLPPESSLHEIEVIPSEKIFLEGEIYVEPEKKQFPLSDEDYSSDCMEVNLSIYNSAEPFPGKLYTTVGVQRFRGYDILIVNLHPVQYIPKEQKIYYYTEMVLRLETISENAVCSAFRSSPEDKTRVMNIVDNPLMTVSYQNRVTSGYTPKSDYDGTSSLVNPSDTYEYVIITSESLKNANGEYTFQELVDSKIAKGLSATIVTVEEIVDDPVYSINGMWGDINPSNPFYRGEVISDYEKFNDTQAKIRNFIRDAYVNWGIEYVLIGGDDDIIPAKYLYFGYHKGEHIHGPSDLYYACLDGNYNSDEDDKWGEPTDGDGRKDVDLVAEVYVGRACVGNSEEVSNFVYKTMAYMNVAHYYLNKVWMVGEHLWSDPDTWGGDYMDELIDGSSNHGNTTVGIPSSEYDISTLYDRDCSWSKSEIIGCINDGTHIINHLGHSYYGYNMKMVNGDIPYLTNDKYCFIYSQGCMAGGFDNPKGYDCIAEYFTAKTEHGAFAGIWNTRYGWGCKGGTDGTSQHFNREFWNAVFGENISVISKANQDSKEDNLWRINGGCTRWCYYEITLFGDPEISIKDLPDWPEIYLNVSRIKVEDQIEFIGESGADWYYHVGFSEDGGNFYWQHSPEPVKNDDDDITIDEDELYTFCTEQTGVYVAIMVCEDDFWTNDDLADVSSDSYGGEDNIAGSIQPPLSGMFWGTYWGYYNLNNNTLTGCTVYTDGDWYKTSGDYDGNTGDENDASVWFKITDNYGSSTPDINPLCVNTDKSIYAPDGNVGVTVWNMGTDALSLKKWYVEKRTLSGVWETIYESSGFFDYIVLPINWTYTNSTLPVLPINRTYTDYTITVPHNGTRWTIANTHVNWTVMDNPDDLLIIPANETVGIKDDTFVLKDQTPAWNWSDTTPSNENISIYKSTDISTIYGTHSSEETSTPPEVKIDQPTGFPAGTRLQPSGKLTWIWPQITSDGKKPGFGDYRVKVAYDDTSVTSSPFSIAAVFKLSEKPILWKPSINPNG